MTETANGHLVLGNGEVLAIQAVYFDCGELRIDVFTDCAKYEYDPAAVAASEIDIHGRDGALCWRIVGHIDCERPVVPGDMWATRLSLHSSRLTREVLNRLAREGDA